MGLQQSEVPVRENRLKSIIYYSGNAAALTDPQKADSFVHKERSYSQCSDCAQMCAGTITYFVRNAAVVVHSPMGCFANTPVNDTQFRNASLERGQDPDRVHVLCSNISENDTVYGGIRKLQKAVQECYDRFRPEAIFVHSSCAAGIVGDDIEDTAADMEKKLGVPVVPVYCEGFKSKIWSSGFDAAYHGILRKIVKPAEHRQKDLVNIFNFLGSDTFTPLLGKIGLRPNYLVPLASVETISHMSEAACSSQICETLGTYVTKELEDNYGVPKVKTPAPFGIEWTDNWLREIAGYTGKENIVEEVIRTEHERIRPQLEELRTVLKGKKVYIFAGDSYAHNVGSIVRDLGMELVGMTTLHHDMHSDSSETGKDTLAELVKLYGDIEHYTVCNKQPYQVKKIIEELRPDVMIVRHMNMTILGGKLGIPSLLEGETNISAGYDGVITTGKRIRNLMETRGILKTLKEYNQFPYSKWWTDQEDPFYFEKK
ncbi:MAG: nitrogenase [Butyrivibrio sp.]|jgi:nitrogenase molybdenum-iron protein alpha chain|nr:nitrogenase [Butyrivibrio sp.]